MIICDIGVVIFPRDRKEQAEDLMALAGDALIQGDKIAYKVLYFASHTLARAPESGTAEADAENAAFDRQLQNLRVQP